MTLRMNKIISFIISITVVINVLGVVIEKNYGIPSFLITGCMLLVMFTCLFIFKNGTIVIGHEIIYIWIINSVTFVAHFLICGFTTEEIKYYMYFIAFIVVLSLVTLENWDGLENGLIIISLIMSIDALRYVPMILSKGHRIHNVANYTLLDKAVYTQVLSIAFVCLLFNVFNESRKIIQIIEISILIFLGCVNVLIIQSKIFLIIVLVSVFILYFLTDKCKRKTIHIFVVCFLFSIIVLFILFPQYIPDYIYIFLNKFFGVFEEIVINIKYNDRYSLTYDIRSNIYKFAFSLWSNHVVFGVGFGNYKEYAIQNSSILNSVTQTESSMLNILVEGGLLYFITHIIFLVYLAVKTYDMYKRKQDLVYVKLLAVLIAYVVVNLGNDFYDLLYWVILGFIYSITVKENKV